MRANGNNDASVIVKQPETELLRNSGQRDVTLEESR